MGRMSVRAEAIAIDVRGVGGVTRDATRIRPVHVHLEAEDRATLDFRDFFQSEYQRLGRALYVLTGDRAEAEELTQEAMVRVYEHWGRVGAMESPTGYLYRTALNLHRSKLRRLGALARKPLRAVLATDLLAEVECRDELGRLLETLPLAQRQALVLVELLGLSAEEAGRVLKIEPVSVRVRLSRARSQLRRQQAGDSE
jgi:RNA polymerase sigma-70 factor (ECF subfamily)